MHAMRPGICGPWIYERERGGGREREREREGERGGERGRERERERERERDSTSQRGLKINRPTDVFFLGPCTKPLPHHMIRQSRTADTVLFKSIER